MTIGELIRAARQEKGWTQKELGLKCGINEVQIRKYELEKSNPKIETLEKITKALEIPIEKIIEIRRQKLLANSQEALEYVREQALEKSKESKLARSHFLLQWAGYTVEGNDDGYMWIEGNGETIELSEKDLIHIADSSEKSVEFEVYKLREEDNQIKKNRVIIKHECNEED